jgi:cation:H+ antiporter
LIYLAFVGGLVLLVGGAELLIRGSVVAAQRLRLSPLIIGVVLVGFGTSSPELVASVTAALEDSPGIAIGNVVGSNICNVLLILAIGALIRPLPILPRTVARDGSAVIAATVAFVAVCFLGLISRAVGAVLLVMLAAYLVWCYRTDNHVVEDIGEAPPSMSFVAALLLALLGLAGLIGGAYLLVDAAITLARQFGVSETIVGLSVVALGTSLPELAATIVAVVRGHSDVAFGNVIGSNIYNILGIIGVTALVRPIAVPSDLMGDDVWIMLASTVAMVVFAATGRISRWEGGALLIAYVGYVSYLAAETAAAAS